MYENEIEVKRLLRDDLAGIEAEHATNALDAIDSVLSCALLAYHRSSMSFPSQAELLGITQRVYDSRLRAAHVDFTLAYQVELRIANAVAKRTRSGPSPTP